jgi:hypothetical protein
MLDLLRGIPGEVEHRQNTIEETTQIILIARKHKNKRLTIDHRCSRTAVLISCQGRSGKLGKHPKGFMALPKPKSPPNAYVAPRTSLSKLEHALYAE